MKSRILMKSQGLERARNDGNKDDEITVIVYTDDITMVDKSDNLC